MRIVQIEDFFHPDAGYQVNILTKYFTKKGNEVFIICAELEKIPDELTSFFGKEGIEELDRQYEKQYNTKIIRVPVKKYISGRVLYSKEIFKIVDELKPDVLYVHGNDTLIGMQYIKRVKKLPYALISDSHMLAMASKNKLTNLFRWYYRHFVTPRIKKNAIPIIRTQDDDYVQKHLGIPLEQCPWISYGSDVLLFHPDEKARQEFRKENGIPENAFVAIFAGKLIESKGALLLAEAFKEKFNTKKEVVLVAVGSTSGDGEYSKKVEKAFEDSKNRIIRFKTQKYSDLARFYQASDIAVFAKQCSLSFYDVQACGLPVISEDNNINVDRCSHHNGLCFESGSVSDFRTKIEIFVNMPDSQFKEYKDNSLQYVYNNYSYDKKSDEYLDVIYKAYNKRRNING